MEYSLPTVTDYGLSYCPKCGNGVLLPVVDRFTDRNTRRRRIQVTLMCVGDDDGCTHQIANPATLDQYLDDDALAKVRALMGQET